MPADRKSLKSNPKNGLFVLGAAFFLIQIAIDLGHSITAFPFVHYGMFSESLPAPDSLLSYEVTVDGRRLDPLDFRIYQWDMIQQPLTALDKQVSTGDFAIDKSSFHSALPGLYTRVSANLDNISQPETRFPEWYAGYLSLQLGHPIDHFEVTKTWYRLENGRLVRQHQLPWIKR
jgi:hypothetical protein